MTNAPAPLQGMPVLGGSISQALDKLEISVEHLERLTPEQAAALLQEMDSLQAQIDRLEGKISRKTAEGQFEMALARLRSQTGAFLQAVGGAAAMQALRATHSPDPSHSWWFLDEWVAQRKLARRRVLILGAAGVLIALALVVVLYQLVFRPDPALEARYAHEQRAQDALHQAKLPQALDEVTQSLTYAPTDASLLVLKGVILELSGQADAAAQAYQLGEQNTGSREAFLNLRGGDYLTANQADKALADAQAVLQMDAKSYNANLIAGTVYEARSDLMKALDFYGRAYDSADSQNHASQAAVARSRMASVLQKINSPADLYTPTPK